MYYTRGKTTPPIYLQARRNRGAGGRSPHFGKSFNPIPIRGDRSTPLPQISRPSYGPDLARERTESAHTFMGQSTYSLPFDEKIEVVGGNKVTNALLSCPVAVKGSDRSRHISRLMPCTISLLFRSS